MIIKQRNVSIGSLTAIVEPQPSPDAYSARRRLILSQSPAANVDVVDPIIAHLAIARGPEPVPFVVQLSAHEWSFGRRTAPQVIVHRGRHWRRRAYRADAIAGAINHRMGITDGADLAAAQVIEGLAQERARTTLRAQLDHPAIFPGRSHHLPAFPEVVGKGFLDINVLARLAGPDCRQRMPVIGQSDDHSVNSLVVQDPAKVHVSGDRFTPILERPAFTVKDRLVHIA